MRLEDIGFYTLNDRRAEEASVDSQLSRAELVLTSRCNFRCPYCKGVGGTDLSYADAVNTLRLWANHGLRNVRFSGGEPTLWRGLDALCLLAYSLSAERIAISTNGSAPRSLYDALLRGGVNDFSISLDACDPVYGDFMAGGIQGAFDTVTENIRWLAERIYTTVGIVLTEFNAKKVAEIVSFARGLGVADIRIIPAAQWENTLPPLSPPQDILDMYPILRYRIDRLSKGQTLRGLSTADSHKCGLVLDDVAVNDGKHFPCIIYMREGGRALGDASDPLWRKCRDEWYRGTDTHRDPICTKNCLDVCIEYNNKFRDFNKKP